MKQMRLTADCLKDTIAVKDERTVIYPIIPITDPKFEIKTPLGIHFVDPNWYCPHLFELTINGAPIPKNDLKFRDKLVSLDTVQQKYLNIDPAYFVEAFHGEEFKFEIKAYNIGGNHISKPAVIV